MIKSRYFLAFFILISLVIAAVFWMADVSKKNGKTNDKRNMTASYYELPKPKPMRHLLPLINDHQKELDLSKYTQGKWSLLYFGYTSCPDICPIEMALINQAVMRMKNTNQLMVIFVSIDPKRDIGNLNFYTKKFNENFIGLSAEEGKLAQIARLFGVYYEYEKTKERSNMGHAHHQYTSKNSRINHTSSFLLLNPKTEYVGIFTTPHDAKKIAFTLDEIISKMRS